MCCISNSHHSKGPEHTRSLAWTWFSSARRLVRRTGRRRSAVCRVCLCVCVRACIFLVCVWCARRANLSAAMPRDYTVALGLGIAYQFMDLRNDRVEDGLDSQAMLILRHDAAACELYRKMIFLCYFLSLSIQYFTRQGAYGERKSAAAVSSPSWLASSAQ